MLLKMALMCSLIGLAVLYFISGNIDLKNYKTYDYNAKEDEFVKINGIISKISKKDNVIFIEIKQDNIVNVVAFGNVNNLNNLNLGDNVEVIGKTQEYKGKNEIIAQKIRIVK